MWRISLAACKDPLDLYQSWISLLHGSRAGMGVWGLDLRTQFCFTAARWNEIALNFP